MDEIALDYGTGDAPVNRVAVDDALLDGEHQDPWGVWRRPAGER
jgi:hypothetical protein